MRIIYLISVYTHILAAMIWIGGMLFLTLIALPVVRALESPGSAGRLIRLMGQRFRDIGWVCIALLLLSGFTNLWYRGIRWESLLSAQFWGTPWGRLLAVKLTVVLAMLINSAWHDFVLGPRVTALMESRPNLGVRSAEVQRLRRQTAWLARINLLLGLVVIALAIMLVRGLP